MADRFGASIAAQAPPDGDAAPRSHTGRIAALAQATARLDKRIFSAISASNRPAAHGGRAQCAIDPIAEALPDAYRRAGSAEHREASLPSWPSERPFSENHRCTP